MNNTIEMQRILMEEINRLVDAADITTEVARSNALTNTVNTVIKSYAIQLRVREVADKFELNQEQLSKQIGLITDEEE